MSITPKNAMPERRELKIMFLPRGTFPFRIAHRPMSAVSTLRLSDQEFPRARNAFLYSQQQYELAPSVNASSQAKI